MRTDRVAATVLVPMAVCFVLAVGCGGEDGGISGGNTLIRVDAPLPGATDVSMGVRISCDGVLEVPEHEPDPLDFRAELERKENDDSEPQWQGIFDLPVGECTFTLALQCDDEIVCIGSQTMTIEDGDNIYDVVLVCALSIGGGIDRCYP